MHNYNLVVPKDNSTFKLLDSGLVFLSKYKILYYEFIPWKVSNKTDRLANKGFLRVTIDFNGRQLNIINLHLQAVYKKELDTKFGKLTVYLFISSCESSNLRLKTLISIFYIFITFSLSNS